MNAFVKAASSVQVIDKMFARRYLSISSIFYALLSSSFSIMFFILIAMEIQEKYLGQKIKRIFRHFPSTISDQKKLENLSIAKQQEFARR